MPTDEIEILCVGNELALIEVRCAVLEQAGYKARTATPAEAQQLLRGGHFDLVILSARLSDEERYNTMLAAGESPTLCLRGLIFPGELLREVESLLALRPRAPRAALHQRKTPPAAG